MFKLLKATAIVSIATIATVITGLIRAKFTAVTLGPSGVGIFSQAFNFQQLAINIASLSIGLGITKYVAQYRSQNEAPKIRRTISAASMLQIAMSLVLVILVSIFSVRLSEFLFSSREYWAFLIILSFGVLFFVLASTIEAVLFGFGNYKAFAKGRSISSILSLVPLFIFISLMNIRGAFIYFALGGVITFTVYYYIFYRGVPLGVFRSIFSIDRAIFSKENLRQCSKDLLSYGGVMFVTGVLSTGTVVLLRSLLIRYYNAEANGYYQVVFSLSAYYLALFTNGLWSYSYAKLSTMRDKADYSVEVNNTIRFCIFGVVPIIVALFLAKDFIIRLVFSDKFIYSRELFSTQLFGDMFFLLFYILGMSLLASAKLKTYLGFGALSSLSFIAIFLLLHRTLGIKAVTTGYLISNLLSSLALIYYHMRKMELKIYARNVKLLFSAAAVCGIVLFFGRENILVIGIKAMLLAVWLYFSSTIAERNKFLSLVMSKVSAIFKPR